jgi:hypothetical protein
MAATKLVDVNDFMSVLQERGLLIVSAAEFEAGKMTARKKLIRKKALSLSEIVKNNFLPVRTTKVLADWIASGKIKSTEWYQEQNGHKKIMILTSAVKRLGYED